MRIWRVEHWVNHNEYLIATHIVARKVERMEGSEISVLADGVEITFSERIESIEVEGELGDV